MENECNRMCAIDDVRHPVAGAVDHEQRQFDFRDRQFDFRDNEHRTGDVVERDRQ